MGKGKMVSVFLMIVMLCNLMPIPMIYAAEGEESSVSVTAAADWYGSPSWQSATLTQTATNGTYILRNTDAGAGYAFYWTPATRTLSLYDKATYVSSMVIPGAVEGIPVQILGSELFRKPVTLNYMVISENVQTIKSNCFRESGLVGIRLPASLATIDVNAFLGCSKLTQINLEQTSLNNLGATSFKQTGLKQITFPASLSVIQREAFYGCSALESVTFLGNLTDCNGVGNISGNQAAFYSTPKLKSITFLGNMAPATVTGFASAGVDYQITVYYPQGGIGYDTDEFKAGFRTGTTFIKKLRAIVKIEGKPNVGATLTGSFSYLEEMEQEWNSLCYWQRSSDADFTQVETISEAIPMKSSDTASYLLTEADRGKYLRFYVQLPASAGEYTEDLHCTSSPTKQIGTFSVVLDAAGAVVGTEFYTTEGIDSYGARAYVYNATEEEKELTLLSAWYSNKENRLVDVNIDTFTVPAGTEMVNGYFEQVLEGKRVVPKEIATLELKILAFDHLSVIRPLAQTKIYKGIYDPFQEIYSTNAGGLYTTSQLNFVREKVRQEQEPWKSAFDQLIQNADAWMEEEPSPVSHWYVPGYYTNATGHIAARSVLMDDLKSAYTCALAYQFTGKASYANQAVRILNAWSKTLATIGSEDSALVFAYVGNGFPMTAELVKGYRDWAKEDKGLFDSWMKNIYLPFAAKCGGSGNSGDWGIFARLAGKAYLEDRAGMQSDIAELERLITNYIDEDGSLPKENERGSNGMWYTYFALAPKTAACQIVYNTIGTDYFHWTSPTGRSLKQALDTYFYYCNNRVEWPYSSSVSFPSAFNGQTWPLPLWEAMAGVYNEQSYLDYVKQYRPLSGPISSGVYHHMAWFYPTLMYGALQLGNGLPSAR